MLIGTVRKHALCFLEKHDKRCLGFDENDEMGDAVCGPVANDNTMPVLNLFLSGFLDEEETIKRLLPQKLKDQYAFKTKQAIQIMRFVEVVECEK